METPTPVHVLLCCKHTTRPRPTGQLGHLYVLYPECYCTTILPVVQLLLSVITEETAHHTLVDSRVLRYNSSGAN
jgi:hypothetical protein